MNVALVVIGFLCLTHNGRHEPVAWLIGGALIVAGAAFHHVEQRP